ncbi:MAG: type IX secretion system membrane protein PorP/SprF [Bacteroidia bacterium]
MNTKRNRMKSFCTALLLIFLNVSVSAQQDPQYSMYMFNQIGVNPAYAGTVDALSSVFFYRNQWTGMEGSPVTEVFNIHTPIRSERMGVGLQFVEDKLGPTRTTSVLATYSYKVKLRKGKLSFGLSGGLMDQVIDYSLIDYKDKTDAFASLGSQGKAMPTFDFGIYYYTRSFYIGLSFTHINQPAYNGFVKDSASRTVYGMIRKHNFITIGKVWVLNDNLSFRPSLLLKTVNGAPGSLDLDASFLVRKVLWLGLTLRSAGSLAFIAQYTIQDRIRIGYAYDWNFAGIGVYAPASHELFLGYDLNIYKSKTLSTRYF